MSLLGFRGKSDITGRHQQLVDSDVFLGSLRIEETAED